MVNQVHMIGLEPRELEWIRMLVRFLRHPNPIVAALAREALIYVQTVASGADSAPSASALPSSRRSDKIFPA